MKLSIITVTLNSKKTIISTLNSILSQTYNDIEHIIVDGGSTDGTLEILKNYKNYKTNKNFRKKIIISKGSGIYKSMNIGIKAANGDLITILNSDDIYQNEKTISKVMDCVIDNPKFSIFLGDVVYFKHTSFFNIYRYYNCKNFKKWHLKIGIMPPHPSSFIRKKIYSNYGGYYEKFLIASDFEIFLRLLYKLNIKYKIMNSTIVRMRMGGISGKNFKSYITSTKEMIASFKLNKISTNGLQILLRIPSKIIQYLFLKKKILNKDFRLFKIRYGSQYLENAFQIIKTTDKIPFTKNFILSGLNLAFLGYYFKGDIIHNKDIVHWPDGIFAKTIFDKIKKIPGRYIIRNMKIPKKIKKIIVLGNLSKKNYEYLKKKFKKIIIHKNLPYGNSEKILNNLDIKFKKNELVFLTLPTPKQEQIAIELSKKNNFFKIICIGASISLASKQEKPVPKFIENFEFLWRLKTEPKRRLKRLFVSLYYFLKGKYLQKKLNYLNIYSIE